MTYNLIYLDDDPRSAAIADGFNTTNAINVNVVKPTSFEQQIQELIQDQESFQGLILDLRLDEDQTTERKAHYTATSLAQHIRSMASDGVWKKEFPIILFTTQPNIERLYSKDVSSHDLFDISFIKDDISDKDIQYKIASIIEAYKFIQENRKNVHVLLGLDNLEQFDKRIFTGSLLAGDESSVYTFARFILKELIYVPGPLIDERYLAARLGIDISQSDHWAKLKKLISATAYSGVYSEAWHRWWMFKVNEWWEQTITNEPLATLDARERVDLLKGKLELPNLTVAEPLPKAASYRFWTICEGFGTPLDPREGFRIDTKEPLPWQDTRYVSLEAALERVHRDKGLKVHPLEKERFNQIKKNLG